LKCDWFVFAVVLIDAVAGIGTIAFVTMAFIVMDFQIIESVAIAVVVYIKNRASA